MIRHVHPLAPTGNQHCQAAASCPQYWYHNSPPLPASRQSHFDCNQNLKKQHLSWPCLDPGAKKMNNLKTLSSIEKRVCGMGSTVGRRSQGGRHGSTGWVWFGLVWFGLVEFSFDASLEPQPVAQKRGRLAEAALAHHALGNPRTCVVRARRYLSPAWSVGRLRSLSYGTGPK
jgi:hypothetical protein